MGAPHSLPISLSEIWEEFQAEIQAEAEEYGSENWVTQVCTVGEVRPTSTAEDGESVAGPGLRVLLPDNHFDVLAELIEEGEEYTCETYRRSMRDEVVFMLLVFEFADSRVAVFVPLFYRVQMAGAMIDEARQEGRLVTQFRTLDENRTVTLQHEDPSLFLPDGH